LNDKIIKISAQGLDSIYRIKLAIEKTVDESLNIIVPVGTVFMALACALTQRTVAAHTCVIPLLGRKKDKKEAEIPVFCLDREKDQPKEDNYLGLSDLNASDEIMRILTISNKDGVLVHQKFPKEFINFIVQHAIWFSVPEENNRLSFTAIKKTFHQILIDRIKLPSENKEDLLNDGSMRLRLRKDTFRCLYSLITLLKESHIDIEMDLDDFILNEYLEKIEKDQFSRIKLEDRKIYKVSNSSILTPDG